jgi:hypothetical protein
MMMDRVPAAVKPAGLPPPRGVEVSSGGANAPGAQGAAAQT